MKFREHRRYIDESMETVQELESSMSALIDAIRIIFHGWQAPETINSDTIKLIPVGHDDRIGWNTYNVVLDDYGVVGMTDGEPVKP